MKPLHTLFLIVFLFPHIFFGAISIEDKAILFYQQRYNDSLNSVQGLEKIIANSSSKDDKIIAQALLSMCFIKHKDIKNASEQLEKCKNEIGKSKESVANAYYYFALYRYKFYIDEVDYQHDLLKAFSIFEKHNKSIFACISAVAIANNSDNIHPTFLIKALDHAKKSNDNDCLLEATLCYTSYLKELYDAKPSPQLQKKTLDAFEKCLIISQKNVQHQMNKAVVRINYANFLVGIDKYPEKTIELLNNALFIAKKYKILSIFRNSYGIRGIFYMNQNKLDLAEKSLLEGIESLKIMPFVDVEVEKNFYENLKDIANRKGDYAQYFQYDQKYTSALKKADKIALEKTIHNAIAKYDLNTKEEKIILLTAQNNLKSGLIIAVVALIILGIIAFFYFYKSIKIKQKYLEQKKEKLQQEKEQTQKELMNSVLHLEKKNEILNELKEKLLEQNKDNHSTIHNSIFKTIDAGLVVDDDFEKFKNNFNSIYPEFFEKLQQKANHTLTQLDLKYCGFILMKVTNKEMAMQMNVEPKSIRMARYRIKQKLQLSKEDDLDQFIQKAIL